MNAKYFSNTPIIIIIVISQIGSLRPIILDAFSFKELKDNVKEYVIDPELCISVSAIVGNSLIDVNDAKYVEGTKIEKMVLNIIKIHLSNPKVCKNAPITLKNLIRADSKCFKSICIVNILFVYYILFLLLNLENVSNRLGKLNVIETLIKVLELHKKDKELCINTCILIMFLSDACK